MKARDAILLTIALVLLTSFVGLNIAGRYVPLSWFMILGTALWAAIDSKKIQLRRYKSGISYGPVALFIAIALLWIVGFPWYLVMRYRIKTGAAVLKDGVKPERSSSMQNVFVLLAWIVLSLVAVLLIGLGYLMLFHHPR